MSSISVTTARPGDAGLVVRVDTSAALASSLVADLAGLVDAAEDLRPGAVVVHLEGGDTPPADRVWPGATEIVHVNRWEQVLRRLERLGAVTIAVVTGRCGGGALDLVLACDYRIAAQDASVAPPLCDSGQVWPGMAVHRMTTQLGVREARRLVLFPQELTALEAVERKLIDEIAADPLAAARDKAAQVKAALVKAAQVKAAGDGGAEAAIRRRLVLDAATTSFEESLGAHLAACDRTLRQGEGEPAR
ncbi:enoyl-CoA-hydratase DpgB [Lentzea sp. NPDC059081]|uniref:enoyl-CoA-hydratase DpgB n=1 Tax=Lentzea sp. NPDC059081 TaxID=3346719 RepID=UPI0036C26D66